MFSLWMASSSSTIMIHQPLPASYPNFSVLGRCATSPGQTALSLLTPPTPFKHSGRVCYIIIYSVHTAAQKSVEGDIICMIVHIHVHVDTTPYLWLVAVLCGPILERR